MDDSERSHAALGRHFARVWRRLAKTGACDALGGAEYRRLYRVWVRRGRPRPIRRWIVSMANRPCDLFPGSP